MEHTDRDARIFYLLHLRPPHISMQIMARAERYTLKITYTQLRENLETPSRDTDFLGASKSVPLVLGPRLGVI